MKKKMCYRLIPLFVILLLAAVPSIAQKGAAPYMSSRNISRNTIVPPPGAGQEPAVPQAVKPCFPLVVDNVYGIFDYVVDLRTERVQQQYGGLFRKYDYAFSGYVWEDILQMMVDDGGKELAESTIIRSEKDLVNITITRNDAQAPFLRYMCRIFGNAATVERYLRKADPDKVSDY